MQTGQPVLAVEFVDVIARRSYGQEAEFFLEEWDLLEESRSALVRLEQLDYYLLIHTILICPEIDVDQQSLRLEKWLRNNHVPFDSIHTDLGKPAAESYVNSLLALTVLVRNQGRPTDDPTKTR